jgi:hypothetical protein
LNTKNERQDPDEKITKIIRNIFASSYSSKLTWTQITNQACFTLSENQKVNKTTVGNKVTESLNYLIANEELQKENKKYCLLEKGRKKIDYERHKQFQEKGFYLWEKGDPGEYEPNESYPQLRQKLIKELLDSSEPMFRSKYEDFCLATDSPEKWKKSAVSYRTALSKTIREINRELCSKNLNVKFRITSYDCEMREFKYRPIIRNNDFPLSKEELNKAQDIVDNYLKEQRKASKGNSLKISQEKESK